MKSWISFLMLIPQLLFTQYWGEQIVEKSFENSELYFKSHYLDNYGLYRFKDVVVNLIDDPFLNLQLNPALLPSLNNNNLVYFDFRGDRTDVRVIDSWVEPYVYDSYLYPRPYPDPRWYSQARREPEPIFSFGLLAFPFSKKLKNIFIGASYQLIYKQENFYTLPTWIYANRLGYDAFGQKATDEHSNIPIQERYVGADEMLNEGHLINGNIGYQFSKRLSIGLSLNSVMHSREGEYLNINNDEYGTIDNNEWKNHSGRNRYQTYDHLDLAGGIQYQLPDDLFAGIKIGILNGDAEQEYLAVDSSKYSYNEINITPEWSYHINRSMTDQDWNHTGNSKYLSINMGKKLKSGQMWKFYYQFTHRNIDYVNNSSINDTSFYSSRWIWDGNTNDYQSHSSLHDVRSGTGSSRQKMHQGMLTLHWQLTRSNLLNVSFYYLHSNNTILSNEPVIASRSSFYKSTGNYSFENTRFLYENKYLDWQYQTKRWSIQVPVFLQFKLNKQFGFMMGVKKSLHSWHVEDQTMAYFNKREKLEQGELKSETNFGELYRDPDKNITENVTDFLAKFDVKLSPQFGIHLLINPEFENNFKIAQWWLGFSSHL